MKKILFRGVVVETQFSRAAEATIACPAPEQGDSPFVGWRMRARRRPQRRTLRPPDLANQIERFWSLFGSD
jgi:hypothetical protein